MDDYALTLHQMVKAAPAAARMIEVPDGLIDTYRFVQLIERETKQRPKWAVQGPQHLLETKGNGSKRPVSTSLREEREKLGRHLIVTANTQDTATFILNSHTVRRRAWIGAGFFQEPRKRPPRPELLLVGVALPLQRWRGPEAALEDLERYRPALLATRQHMMDRSVTRGEIRALAVTAARTVYLPGHTPISTTELADVSAESLYGVLWAMLDKLCQGAVVAAADRRKIKPVKGPDAIVHCGNALFNAGIELLPGTLALPTFRKT